MAGYNLQPFDGKGEFSIWQQKMKGILIQQKVFKAIDGRYSDSISKEKILKNDDYAYSSIILNLSDNVLRKVGKQNSARDLWEKLEELYTNVSLPSKLFLHEKFFRCKLDLSKTIDENLDDFTRLVQDIKLIGDKNIDEYSPIVLLNAIPDTYSNVKAAIKYGRDSVSLDIVVNGLKSKEIDLKTNRPSNNQHEVNSVRGSLVSMANEKRCEIKGIGDISLIFNDGYKMTLKNHKRFGHISQKGLEFLNKEGVLCDKVDKLQFCDDCVMGKQHRVHFPAAPSPNPSMSSCILDYIHADVWGPSKEPTHGGNRYFLSIVDNFSRKVFVILLKHKSEVFEKFETWKILVETKRRQKTNPYTPQQNGVAERMNRTLFEKVRCLLISSGLQKSFWDEAVLTAAYLINLSPSVPLLGKSPKTVWSGKKHDISFLRTFGCSAFVHQNFDKREPRSMKCVFIGYPVGIKGYRLWDRSQPGYKVIISRNVTFNEDEMPCLSKSETTENDLTFNEMEDNQEEGEYVEMNNEQNIEESIENPNPLEDYKLARDRNRRERRISSRLNNFQVALNIENLEPSNVDEALKSKEWLSAMNEEMKSLKDNHTWDLVPTPKDCSLVDCKWIFKSSKKTL
ncbi:UNVERIFIED_CONTAM: Retrovirus-related Pol polyprotein from transposon TNT 1-94 [Sesamum indicum]